jgi:hypothetical protein
LPELYPASFSFSPAIADGTLSGYQMCDWIDNAIALQMSRTEGQIYGYVHLPCRVEVNARLAPAAGGEAALAEFTGERVIPGQVDVDLLNEHLARYAFAARLARGKRVLDAGCGAGYGSAELARAADSVTGVDAPPRPSDFARAHYRLPNLAFEQASCEALPHPDACFDLVVAFEVIEHLEGWRGSCWKRAACSRPAASSSSPRPTSSTTPNRAGVDGANPFHVHEFDFEEFRGELTAVFPHVSLFLENHVEGVTFQPHQAGAHRDGSAGGCRRPRARRIALLRGRLRPPPADRQSDLRLRAARRQRAARARTPHRPARCGGRPEEPVAAREQENAQAQILKLEQEALEQRIARTQIEQLDRELAREREDAQAQSTGSKRSFPMRRRTLRRRLASSKRSSTRRLPGRER